MKLNRRQFLKTTIIVPASLSVPSIAECEIANKTEKETKCYGNIFWYRYFKESVLKSPYPLPRERILIHYKHFKPDEQYGNCLPVYQSTADMNILSNEGLSIMDIVVRDCILCLPKLYRKDAKLVISILFPKSSCVNEPYRKVGWIYKPKAKS